MERLERQAASRPVERTYTRGIGTCMYPNVRGYELEPRPKEYLRIECPHLSNNIIYFTEKGSDRICVIFWEWDEFQKIIAPFGNRLGEEQRKYAFRRKFETLRNLITEIMGQPQSVELESADLDPETDQFLDTITWHTGNGINISHLLKGDLVYQLRNMRMCIYRE